MFKFQFLFHAGSDKKEKNIKSRFYFFQFFIFNVGSNTFIKL